MSFVGQTCHKTTHKHHHFDVENYGKDPKFKVSDHMRILKYKNIFVKSCIPDC